MLFERSGEPLRRNKGFWRGLFELSVLPKRQFNQANRLILRS
jgi:hypothetical protein